VVELLAFLIRALVDHPDAVSIDQFEEQDGTLVLEVSVAEDDVGQVIGRRGRTIAALRQLVRAAATKQGRRVMVDVVD
jgi:predicted RNA-binding protein YlqC (UPF0109 family)